MHLAKAEPKPEDVRPILNKIMEILKEPAPKGDPSLEPLGPIGMQEVTFTNQLPRFECRVPIVLGDEVLEPTPILMNHEVLEPLGRTIDEHVLVNIPLLVTGMATLEESHVVVRKEPGVTNR